jgi:hypothetical protein
LNFNVPTQSRAKRSGRQGRFNLSIRNQRAFVSGALFVGIAIFFFVESMSYPLGTATRMGPAYFPIMLSILLALIGLAVMAGAVATRAKLERLARWDLKGLAWIVASIVLFTALLYPLGGVVALLVLVVVSSRASPEFTWVGTLVNAAVLIAMCVGIFVYGIGLQMPLWPAFMY